MLLSITAATNIDHPQLETIYENTAKCITVSEYKVGLC